MKRVRSTPVRVAAGFLVSGITLYLALRNLAVKDIWDALFRANGLYVGLALLSVAVNTAGKALRWKVLMGPAGQKVTVLKITSALLIGHALNLLFPTRVGDLARVYAIGDVKPDRAFVLGTIVVEKLLDLLSYGLLFVSLLLVAPLPTWVSQSGFSFLAVAILASAVVIAMLYRPNLFLTAVERGSRWLPDRVARKAKVYFRSGTSSLQILQSRRNLFLLSFWSAIVWATAILTNHLALLALDIHLSLTASLLLLIALQASISIPSIPGRIGIFEYVCILTLAVLGVEQAPALSYGIMLHTIVLLLPMFLGLFCLIWTVGLMPGSDQALSAPEGN